MERYFPHLAAKVWCKVRAMTLLWYLLVFLRSDDVFPTAKRRGVRASPTDVAHKKFVLKTNLEVKNIYNRPTGKATASLPQNE